jgi:transcriptional regulator with XRE-family HTH domain
MNKTADLPGLGSRLRIAREDAGLSQAQASKLLGLHRPTLSEIESDNRRVTAGELRNFATAYRVSTLWLLGEPLQADENLKMAARQLEGLRPQDLDTVMRVVDSFRRGDT